MKRLLPLLLALTLGGCTQWNAYHLTGSYAAKSGETAVFTGSKVTLTTSPRVSMVFDYKVEASRVYLHSDAADLFMLGFGEVVTPEFEIIDSNTVRYSVVGTDKQPITFARVP